MRTKVFVQRIINNHTSSRNSLELLTLHESLINATNIKEKRVHVSVSQFIHGFLSTGIISDVDFIGRIFKFVTTNTSQGNNPKRDRRCQLDALMRNPISASIR